MKHPWTALLLCLVFSGCAPATVLQATPIALQQELKKPVVVDAFVMGEFSGALGGRFKDLLATELETRRFRLLWDPAKTDGDHLLVANVESREGGKPSDPQLISQVTLRVIERQSGDTLWRYTYQRNFFSGSTDQQTARELAGALLRSFVPRAEIVNPSPVKL
ncbi:hypothetical protein [Deinococcus roseus]|uniref:DUF4136 domain-containing protein n=1 Tax=Deinococcus roseus TaxID=392414 RepID=A0ABQ2CTS7_9DEIO|nr:hypothetical protein [Deinococcus roseus]GGJ18672.1 hypothetical protein GCM10008938_00980 [Deinococcus roseus]